MVTFNVLLGCTIGGSRPAWAVEFTFGVYRTDTASQVFTKFKPVIDELEKRLQTELDDDEVRVKMKIFKTYVEARESLLEGKVDFVRTGAASYVLVKNKDPNVRLLAMEEKKGKKHFGGVIAVAKESQLGSLVDLKGKRFAFGDPSSTMSFLAKADFVDAGIHATDMTKIGYLGRHDLVAKRVSLHDFDAGSLKESTFSKSADKLRVLKRIRIVTKPWIARSGMDDRNFSALQKSLLGMDHSEAFKALRVSGFVETSDDEYEAIRKRMKRAQEF